MQLTICHETHYGYTQPAQYGLLQVRMRPRTQATQTVRDWTLNLEGARHHRTFPDQFGTAVDLIELEPGAHDVQVQVTGTVDTHMEAGIIGRDASPVPLWLYLRHTHLTQADTAILELAESVQNADLISRLHGLKEAVLRAVPYEIGATAVGTTASKALAIGKGVCQDHTHIFLAAVRAIGLPARYVSGYLMMDGQTDQDASHAWAEVHIPDLGWVGFDISNGISPDERYVKIGHGLDYSDCAPTRGLMIGAVQEQLEVSIQVQQ